MNAQFQSAFSTTLGAALCLVVSGCQDLPFCDEANDTSELPGEDCTCRVQAPGNYDHEHVCCSFLSDATNVHCKTPAGNSHSRNLLMDEHENPESWLYYSDESGARAPVVGVYQMRTEVDSEVRVPDSYADFVVAWTYRNPMSGTLQLPHEYQFYKELGTTPELQLTGPTDPTVHFRDAKWEVMDSAEVRWHRPLPFNLPADTYKAKIEHLPDPILGSAEITRVPVGLL